MNLEVNNNEEAMVVADKLKHAKELAAKNVEWAKETYEERQQQNKEWFEKIKNDNQERVNFYESQLDAYAMTLPNQRLDLPNILITHGIKKVIKYPKSKTELLKLAKQYSPDAIKTEEKVNWTDIKNSLVFSDNGKAISSDGEFVKEIEVTEEPKTNVTIR